jgi:tellurite methyltransferase
MAPGGLGPGAPRTPWDERYAEGDWVDVREPSRILTDALPWLPHPGRALDLACGAGRNALFLAERGWRVMGVDLSLEGLRLLGERARARDLPILPVLADAGEFGIRPGAFDLVVNTFFLLRSAFPLIREALRPGGLLVLETFSVIELEELGGDIRRAFTLERGELLEAFGDFEVRLHEEGVFERDEGERGLARLVARKRG